MAHASVHPITAAACAVVAAVLMLVVRNRVIRRRLLFVSATAVLAAAVHFASGWRPDHWLLGQHGKAIELLILSIAAANGVIALVFNPWFRDGESDRAPAIVQDALVVAAGLMAGLVVFEV